MCTGFPFNSADEPELYREESQWYSVEEAERLLAGRIRRSGCHSYQGYLAWLDGAYPTSLL
jgi:hypothetical protein